MNKNTPTWAILVICWLALLCDGYDLYVYGGTLPGFLSDPAWGVTTGTAGAVGSIALVGMLIGSLSAGILTDKLGRRKLMLISLGIFTVAMVLSALAPTFAVFGVFRFITCLGVGGLLPTAVAVANEVAPKGKSSLAVGAVLLGPAVGALIGALTAGAFVHEAGVRPVYAIGGLSVVVFFIALFFLPESEAFLRVASGTTSTSNPSLGHVEKKSALSGLFSHGRLPATLLMWAACLLSLLVMGGITTWLPVIMQNAGFAMTSSIGFLAIYSLGGILGTIIIAFIAQLTAPKYLVVFGFTAATIALVGVTLTHNQVLLVLAILIAGVGGMGTQNLINDHVAQYYPAEVRATALGWTLAVGRIGMIIGPTYGGLAATVGGSPGAAALWFAIPAAFGVIVSVAMPKRDKRNPNMPAGSQQPLAAEGAHA